MKVLSDIRDAADSRQVTLLGLLNLSAAFDTVDHDILLVRLESSFSIGGSVLAWLKSFLSDRQQAVSKWCHFSFPLSRVRRSTGVCHQTPVVPLHS